MANTTIRGALSIHGKNPQALIETVIRSRIYECNYWKEHCFALTAESLIDKALEVRFVGGVYGGNQQPTEFLCLLLKLLQIQPEKEILVEYLRADEFKYLRALAAFYIRLTFSAVDVFELLEPLLKDFRKLRNRNTSGYALTFMDEFVDALLTEERVCDLILPRMAKRQVLEENGEIGPRQSRLLDALEGKSERGSSKSRSRSRSGSPKVARGRSPTGSNSEGEKSRGRSGSRSDVGSRYVSRSRSRSGSRFKSRSPSVGSPEPMETEGGPMSPKEDTNMLT